MFTRNKREKQALKNRLVDLESSIKKLECLERKVRDLCERVDKGAYIPYGEPHMRYFDDGCGTRGSKYEREMISVADVLLVLCKEFDWDIVRVPEIPAVIKILTPNRHTARPKKYEP